MSFEVDQLVYWRAVELAQLYSQKERGGVLKRLTVEADQLVDLLSDTNRSRGNELFLTLRALAFLEENSNFE